MNLHLEHLNQRLKGTMRNMGANLTDNSVTMAAQYVWIVDSSLKTVLVLESKLHRSMGLHHQRETLS